MIDDLAILAGTLCLASGAWLVHPALCWVVVGCALILVGIAGAKRKTKEKAAKK